MSELLKPLLTEPVLISIITSGSGIAVMLIKHRVTRSYIVSLEKKLDECIAGKHMLVDILVESRLITRERAESLHGNKNAVSEKRRWAD